MKFLTKDDAKLFLAEIGRTDLLSQAQKDLKPTDEMLDLFIKKRRKLIPGLKNFRKSQVTKAQWRKNRFKMLRGIKRFHRSTQGKRFHRALGNFIATRDFTKDSLLKDFSTQEHLGIQSVADFLKGLNSAKTHILCEFSYYMPINDYVDYLLFAEEAIMELNQIEDQVCKFKFDLTEDQKELLFKLVDEYTVLESISRNLNQTEDKVKELYDTKLQSFDFENGSYLTFYSSLIEDLSNTSQ